MANKVEKLQQAQKQLQNLARGGRVDIFVLDLYAEAEVTAAIERIAALPKANFDYLVNAAGTFKTSGFLISSIERLSRLCRPQPSDLLPDSEAVARKDGDAGQWRDQTSVPCGAKQAIKATPSSAYSMAKRDCIL